MYILYIYVYIKLNKFWASLMIYFYGIVIFHFIYTVDQTSHSN